MLLQLYPRKNKRKTYLDASTALSQEEQEINIPCCLYSFIPGRTRDKHTLLPLQLYPLVLPGIKL
jgi:hypothetical protein